MLTKTPFWKKQPLNGLIAITIFMAPALFVGFIWGPLASAGALMYLAILFLIGEVSVKWIPWKKKFRGPDHNIGTFDMQKVGK